MEYVTISTLAHRHLRVSPKIVSPLVIAVHFQHTSQRSRRFASSPTTLAGSVALIPTWYPLTPWNLSPTLSSTKSRAESADRRTSEVNRPTIGSRVLATANTALMAAFWCVCARESTRTPGSMAVTLMPDNLGSWKLQLVKPVWSTCGELCSVVAGKGRRA